MRLKLIERLISRFQNAFQNKFRRLNPFLLLLNNGLCHLLTKFVFLLRLHQAGGIIRFGTKVQFYMLKLKRQMILYIPTDTENQIEPNMAIDVCKSIWRGTSLRFDENPGGGQRIVEHH